MYFCPNWEEPLKKEIDTLGHDKFYFSGSMIEQNSGILSLIVEILF